MKSTKTAARKPGRAAVSARPAAKASAPVVIAARDLSLVFETADGPVHALSKVNLDIGKGEFVSFIGPSGCGKTTFLRVIADLEQPTSGTIAVNGMTPEEARMKRAYGYVFQAAALYPWRTIEKNVALPLEIMGLPKAEREERVKRTLALVNLTGFEKKYPWQLSGGMQQRASIARALSFDADLLLMDEPFGALDEIVRDHLNEQLAGAVAADRQDHLLRHPLHSGGGVSVDPHRGDEPASGPCHRHHRIDLAGGAPARNSRNAGVPRHRAARARGPEGGAQL